MWSVLVLTISVVTTATMPAFVEAIHPLCLAEHECGKTATIGPCCCGEQDNSSNQGGPVESKVQLAKPSMPVAADLTFAAPRDVFNPIVCPYSWTTRAAPLDLPTLFASLLI